MSNQQILLLEERIAIGIDAGESHFREFKSAYERKINGATSARDAKAICKNVGEVLVLFRNADGGELILGVEDDGTVTGVPHKDSIVDMIKGAYLTHIHNDTPIPKPVVGEVELEGKRIIYFSVSKSSEMVHLTSDGRCLRRHDRENRPVPAEHIQAERQERRSLEYDREFVDGASVKDLKLDLVQEVQTKWLLDTRKKNCCSI